MGIGMMVMLTAIGVVTSSPVAQSSVHVKFVSPPHAYSHGVEVPESIPGVTITPRRFLDVSPSSRRFVDVSPSPRRIIDDSPNHRRFIGVSPSPRSIIDAPSIRRRYVDVTADPRRRIDASPSPRRFVGVSPSPRRFIDASPNPRRIISVSPSSRSIISISPDPNGIVTISPGPRRIVDAGVTSRRMDASLPRADRIHRNRGSRKFVFRNEDVDGNSIVSNPEAMWPNGVFLPPDDQLTGLGFHLTDHSYDGLTEEADDDPLLLTGTEAMETVKYLFSLGELFFDSIPHDRALMANQVHRRDNGLDGNRLGSNRPESPFYRWTKRTTSF